MASKVWQVMNDLELTISKVCSAREIIDVALDAIQNRKVDKAESLMSAAYEFLGYYLDEFDVKFKDAWKEAVVTSNSSPIPPQQEYLGWKDVNSSEFDKMFTDKDKAKQWVLPIEKDFISGDYFVTFPDDLLKEVDLTGGDEVEWIDRGDGSFQLRKVQIKPPTPETER